MNNKQHTLMLISHVSTFSVAGMALIKNPIAAPVSERFMQPNGSCGPTVGAAHCAVQPMASAILFGVGGALHSTTARRDDIGGVLPSPVTPRSKPHRAPPRAPRLRPRTHMYAMPPPRGGSEPLKRVLVRVCTHRRNRGQPSRGLALLVTVASPRRAT